MFNYIKDVIINDVANTVVKDSDTNTLVIKRGANYKFDNIIDKKVFKTVGNAGTCATLTIPFVATTSTYDYYQFAIFVSIPSERLSDYALANWHEFGKPILFESAASDVNGLADTFKLMLQPDNELYTVEVSSSNVVLTFKESWMKVAEVNIYKHNATTGELEDDNRSVTKTDNVLEFATAKWLVENLRFPSYPNLRYNHLYADESPVAGTVYDQYSFQYGVKHYIDGGLSGVGQNVDSITTHVFYVPHAQASTFEGKFDGCTFVTDKAEVSSMNVYANDTAAASAAAASAAETAAAANTTSTSTNAPTTSTVGKVGDTIVVDGDIYTCVAIDESGSTPSYSWVLTHSESGQGA
jgi:hypothetical protein